MSFDVLALAEHASEWDTLLEQLSPRQRDVFFTSPYLLLWEERGDGRAFGAVYADGRDLVLYPFLLRDLSRVDYLGEDFAGLHDITTPMGFGGPLIRQHTSEDGVGAFRAAVDDWCRENDVVSESVRFHPLIDNRLGVQRYLEIEEAGRIVWCRLDQSSCSITDRLSAVTRRNVRRAREAGVTAGVETTDGAYDRFAELYLENALRRKALPAYRFDTAHFARLRRALGPQQVLIGARYQKQLVAAALFVRGPEFVHFHAMGVDRASSRLRPINLLFFEAMQWACDQGARAINLGGGYRGDDEFFRFKVGFGRQLAAREIGRVVHRFEDYARAEARRDDQGEILDCGYFPVYRAPLPTDSLLG